MVDNSQDEDEALGGVLQLAKWMELDKGKVSLNEYRRLVNTMPVKKENMSVDNRAKHENEFLTI